MKKASIAAGLLLGGAGDRNRTCDLRVTSALLYLLSYTGGGREISIVARPIQPIKVPGTTSPARANEPATG